MSTIAKVLIFAACVAGFALAQQAASPAAVGGKSEINTKRGEYEIVPQTGGKTYALHRLAQDGITPETIVLTKTGEKNGEVTYIDAGGTRYTRLSDGSLREERVQGSALPVAQTRIERAPSPAGQPAPAAQASESPAVPVSEPPPPAAVATGPPAGPPATPVLPSAPYNGPMSGTFNCVGASIPQNGEKVFPNLPGGVKLELHYDTTIWDAQLQPAGDQTQRLVLRNKKAGMQKKCVVHWNVIP